LFWLPLIGVKMECPRCGKEIELVKCPECKGEISVEELRALLGVLFPSIPRHMEERMERLKGRAVGLPADFARTS
jgi:predicted amidophosphoribosyltransferase